MQTSDNILQFKTRTSKKTSFQSLQEFSRLEEIGRTIRIYDGVLPCAKGRAKHILKCEHLRQLPDEYFAPYKAEKDYTHQIWLWYRRHSFYDKSELVFRGQFNFAVCERSPDIVAGEITDFLAYLMINSKGYREELFRPEEGHLFWISAIETKLQTFIQEELALLWGDNQTLNV